ncbi:MAG: Bax inhibitor-1/YccA family protein [Bacilli bacterium]|nr:Bax inhibitor-1/YccA family protein [Bacilli bacterium]
MINKIMPKVFMWMCLGLLITFFTGYYVASHEFTAMKLLGGYKYLILIIIEVILVIYLSVRITKMSPTTARIVFLLYAILNGLTFCGVFLVYNITSVIYVFLITALVFGIFAFIGWVTKLDLTKIGAYIVMALIGVIICSVINIFINSGTFDFIISIISILVFVGFTAYDVQKIKRLASSSAIAENNLAIYGALELYLDFINLFIDLLRIFGKSNN